VSKSKRVGINLHHKDDKFVTAHTEKIIIIIIYLPLYLQENF